MLEAPRGAAEPVATMTGAAQEEERAVMMVVVVVMAMATWRWSMQSLELEAGVRGWEEKHLAHADSLEVQRGQCQQQ